MTISAADRHAIRDRLESYFHSLDTRDFALTESCFTADADIQHRGGRQRFAGPGELVTSLPGMLAPYRSTIHAVAAVYVREEQGRMRAEYSVIVTLERTDGMGFLVRGVRYDDDVVRRDGDWLIARRLHNPVWQYAVQAESPAPDTI